ncbi:MAG: hypothetical protein CL431_10620 [Acidimicrobiaceae bacterium]|nr:hypothetical protein [Acidimicrobiaceae bacterium]|tara:strand:- start:9576 stop:9995 length:420 start_codon:yes stop_codon:yes gene_type:complete
MIEKVMDKWFAVVRGEGDIRDLLHDDCVFWSPVLFHPQVGAELTAMYLSAAGVVFPGDNAGSGSGKGAGGFRYTKKVIDGNHAVLEFETTMGGLSVNGVDIITCDDDGKIVEFKVMLRPQKAVEKAREQMMVALEEMNS